MRWLREHWNPSRIVDARARAGSLSGVPRPPPIEPKRVVSAERAAPLEAPVRRITGEFLRVNAKESVLNGAGVLRDTWADFQGSDRYFKYKAAVIGIWFALTVTSVAVACPPGSGLGNNPFGARLVIAGEAKSPIFMVKNDSTDPWQDVEVVVNGEYRSTASHVEAQREITLSPVLLYNGSGARAPSDLRILEIVVQISDDKVTLLKGGQPQ